MDENRVVTLEELVAHQSQQLEELSDQLAKQWKIIDKLTNKLADLSEHYSDLEDQISGPAVTKPPHY
ncbi:MULTISPECIES: SlyX family protein [unclassified Lentilitoribacter]|jgi:SlyX protein|uniref:SlyX family protein n=1 Tax=unclassified Lentilitoribacter TaxID=2647570 RepID=UPI0013A6C219|nr:SlyX family protein [Lentilitoribacter sp. Alg239-R112]